MQDAAARRHPLHVAGADHAALPGRVAMRDLALVDDGHGLEAAVRMLANPARALRRREVGRPGIVQKQKRAQLLAVAHVRKHRAHRKAISDPVLTRCAVDAQNALHV
ncbi:hypothetical protein D3C72_1824240 [compost metagenome]